MKTGAPTQSRWYCAERLTGGCNGDGTRVVRTCFPSKHGERMEWDKSGIQLACGMESLYTKKSKKFIRKKSCMVGGRAFMTHQMGVNSVVEQL